MRCCLQNPVLSRVKSTPIAPVHVLSLVPTLTDYHALPYVLKDVGAQVDR